MNEILGHKNTGIYAMMKLQAYSTTDNEIFIFHEFMNRAHGKSAASILHIPFDSFTSNSYDLNLTNNRCNFGTPK